MKSILLVTMMMIAVSIAMKQSASDIEMVKALLSIPQEVTLGAFAWKNCGPADAVFKVNNLELPDPLILGGEDTVTASSTLSADLTAESITSIDLYLAKKIFGHYVKVPCIDNVGSCSVSDICAQINENSGKICPILTPLGIPCACPIKAGTYSVTNEKGELPNPGYSWLTSGDFEIQFTINGPSGVVGCLNIQTTIKTK
eukprot:TRINITY_DN2014_c0_g1_i1.p1 TRINITY_DN2014_c0_g1~~TRINITY_DN2014_c0_g1_i1.p1  ORF type:complete len:207 (-),score=43.93 TRINITY_DN2014_c0_g1_i1:35-634(-)